MINIAVICEGQTEAKFISQVFNSYFDSKLFLYPITIPTSENKKGGCLKYERVKKIINNISQNKFYNYITTMFDYYALNSDFPDINNNTVYNPDIYITIRNLENSFKNDIDNKINNTIQFIPYYQLHEFETLLYTDINNFLQADSEWTKKQINTLQKDVKDYDNIELINNCIDTSPSHRIEKIFNKPKYNKMIHGIKIIQATGLDNIRAKCRHFNEWCVKLETLYN